MSEEWIVACDFASVAANDVVRCDIADATYAVIKLSDGRCSVIDGLCTHGKAHLAEGFVDGTTIECPKHNGRFNALTGEPVAFRTSCNDCLRNASQRRQNRISQELTVN